MERAFHRRFGSSLDGRYEALKIMGDSWKKIYSRHESHDQVCISGGVGGGVGGGDTLTMGLLFQPWRRMLSMVFYVLSKV